MARETTSVALFSNTLDSTKNDGPLRKEPVEFTFLGSLLTDESTKLTMFRNWPRMQGDPLCRGMSHSC